jgi:hypothetical protein
MQRLAINAVHWTLDKPVPKQWKGKTPINVAYDSHEVNIKK